MTPRGILFDKDGTLLDYHATWMPANHAVAQELAGDNDDLALHLLTLGGWDSRTDRVGSGTILAAGNLREIAELWLPHLDSDLERTVASMTDFLDRCFQEHMAPTPVCNLGALLDRLSQADIVLGIATADSERGLVHSLTPFGILHRFVYAVGFDSGHGCKPEPGMVHGFCSVTGLDAAEVVVVGDNRHDIAMAIAAGATGIGVLTGTSDADELIAAGAVAAHLPHGDQRCSRL